MNERNLQADIDRAEHASRLLQDELLNEALRTIRQEIISQWVATDSRQEKDREGFWMFAKTVDNFELLLKGYVETGKLASKHLQALNERKGLRKVFG
jgi:hypothetical protein